MTDNLQSVITATIARAPDWVRQELLSKEKTIRVRAEEALAAKVAAAIQQGNGDLSGH